MVQIQHKPRRSLSYILPCVVAAFIINIPRWGEGPPGPGEGPGGWTDRDNDDQTGRKGTLTCPKMSFVLHFMGMFWLWKGLFCRFWLPHDLKELFFVLKIIWMLRFGKCFVFTDYGNILQIRGIFCRWWEYFADYGNNLQSMEIFCRLWEYFSDSGTPRWRDAAGIWRNVVVLLSPGGFHHHHHH